MAGILAHVDSGEVSLTADTAKTVLQLVAPANHRLVVTGLRVYGKGTNPIGSPLKVRLLRQTTAGTMTAVTPVANDSTIDETLQATAQRTATVEPTAGAVLRTMELHPQAGMVEWFPPGQGVVIPGGTRLGVECTSAQALSVAAGLTFEE